MAAQFGILAAAGVAAAVAVGGGVSYAARDAQPGDSLYSLRASLYHDVSGDASADTDFLKMSDLFSQADKADKDNQFDASAKADIGARFRTHIDAIEDRIATFEAEGNTEASAGLRRALEVHIRNYTRLFGSYEDDGDTSSSSMASSNDSDASASSDDMDSSASMSAESSTEASVSSDDDDSSEASVGTSASAGGSLDLSL